MAVEKDKSNDKTESSNSSICKKAAGIKAFVFDMDGLLFDSERIVQRSWEIAGDELGILHMGDVIYHTLGMNRAGRNEYFRKHIREDFPFEEFGELTRDNVWKIVDKEGLPLKRGAKELLAYGKAQGYKMAVATSSSREYAMKNLIRAGIDSYFDNVICGDMVKKAKPDPEIYQKACESLGISPADCMAFEDAPGGILSAHQAGMQVIMVPDLVQPTQEIRELTYRVCDSLADVIGILN